MSIPAAMWSVSLVLTLLFGGLAGASFQGFGCPSVSGTDPAFDNLVVERAVPVERFSWGAVKALYRRARQSDWRGSPTGA